MMPRFGGGQRDTAIRAQPGQSLPHSGENGSANPTASMIGCSRSTVSAWPQAPTRPISSASVVSSVALSGYAYSSVRSIWTSPVSSVRHRAHSPTVGAETVPLTSTPSDTDCNCRSSSSGAPFSMATNSTPIRTGLGTVSR
ncbi:Uncharacterised protein [Mycolicibacterium fortuitum]|uniref:Uncharacterized protein n=1 Tax=Mycolicibacterium fortuitum TaxID=1766 RepID=A0A378U7P5_MYCFO|nr:Uncharacterised protein [Mycolicibacterium fortuitum]